MALGVYEQARYRIRITLPDGDVQYESVRGARIGRFGVRPRDPSHMASGGRKFSVDHIPSGFLLITTDTFEDGVRVADDLSRFSVKDPSAKDRRRAAVQLGDKLRGWLVEQDKRLARGLPLQDYREFYGTSPQAHW